MEKSRLIKIMFLFITSIIFLACNGSGSSEGAKAGSLARFSINNDNLYTINGSNIDVLDINDTVNLYLQSSSIVSWNIETLFSYKNLLYVGSDDGFYIMKKDDRGNLEVENFVTHFIGCDPIIVNDDIAYVTLHSSSNCRGTGLNELQIYDVNDTKNIKLLKIEQMKSPKGLGIDKNKLFICDGEEGLKIYDINKSNNIFDLTQIEQLKSIDCFDLIVDNNILFISSSNKIFQYDYSKTPIQLLSIIDE